MLIKSHYSTDQELFEKIVNSNPALHKQLTWGKMLVAFFDELFPHSRRSVSLGITLGGVALATLFSWTLLLSPLTEIDEIPGDQVSINQVQAIDGTVDVAWEDSLNSLMVGRFWIEE